MSIKDKLKSIFGWGTVPVSKKLYDDPTREGAEPVPVSMYDQYNEMLSSTRKLNRCERYDTYDAMDEMSDVATVLDAYAEDATQVNKESESVVWVEGDSRETVDELTNLFNTIGVEEWIEGCTRDTGKLGDDFARVIGSPEQGITSLEWQDPRDVERIENIDGILLGFEYTRSLGEYKKNLAEDETTLPTYKPWDFIHFRIYKQKRLPQEKHRNIYGTSLLWASDRIAKQIKILDDLLMIVRLTKSLDRRIYYVPTGRSPVEEEVRILKKWRRALKRKSYMDPVSGRFDSKFNPYAFTEDEFWPSHEGDNAKVETIPGMGNVGEQVDIDHFRDKFYGSLRAPKAFFGYEGDVNAKSTLSTQSIKWARAVGSLQKAIRQGLTRIAQVHLAYKGIDTDADKFRVLMVAPSVLELIDRLESWQQIIDVAERMSVLGDTLSLNKFEWTKYILENVLWLSKQDTKMFLSELEQEALSPSVNTDELPTDDTDDQTVEPDDTEVEPSNIESESKESRLLEIDRVISRMAGIQPKIAGARLSELPDRKVISDTE